MGKKTKIGKQRKDKYYHLAKETGYRSRAAFKLLQLNRKFEFLQKSRVLVDLCAAPGGWMQVAVRNMPVSSLVVGVDLFPIKSIQGCIAIQEDITTQKCLQLLKRELKTWKADVVLHDGAPNVGQNWIQDAYEQNCLTLSALKLATQLLRDGGYFVTKVFRSKDYNSLIWVFQQLFRHVFSTKPAASRNESAEIFVVCKGYLAPNTIDPKLLDPKYAFEDIEAPQNKKQMKQLLAEVGKKKKAEGYPTGEVLLYKPIKASEFVHSADHIELLANTSEIVIDQSWIDVDPNTTDDIRDFCKDVKVLGKKEIKGLINWRTALKKRWEEFMKLKNEGDNGETALLPLGDHQEDEEESDTETKIEAALLSIQDEQRRQDKRKKKKLLKDVKKIQEKTSLEMIIPGDTGPTDTTEDSLFNLKALKRMEDVENLVTNPQMPEVEEHYEMDEQEELEFYQEKRRNKVVRYNREEEILDDSGLYYRKLKDVEKEARAKQANDEDSEEEVDLNTGLGLDEDDKDDSEDEQEISSKSRKSNITKSEKAKTPAKIENTKEPVKPSNMKKNPLIEMDLYEEPQPALLTDLDPRDKNVKRMRKAERFFDNDIFKTIGTEMEDMDEDMELNKLAEEYMKKGARIPGFEKEVKEKEDAKNNIKKIKNEKKATQKRKKTEDSGDEEQEELEVVSGTVKSSETKKEKKVKMDAEGLALATVMVQSKKSRRELTDEGWNRYAFNDEGLPEWFVQDEKKHMKKEVPVPATLVDEYKNNLMEINARPIKKVMEAKARKKKRALKKMEKAKKKAEAILEKGELTEQEKAAQIKQLYKKAKQTKKKEVTYVVAKKFNSGKRVKRPVGVKGPMKVVDPRMKKDNRRLKTMSKGKGKKGGKKMKMPGGGGGRKGGRR